jgi:hypothetical protein
VRLDEGKAMTDLGDDLVMKFVRDLTEPVRLLLANNYWTAAMKLLYSGIDSLAFLGLPADRVEVEREDFQDWCSRYVDLGHKDQPIAEELYAARCGLLHSHSTASRASRTRGCREIDYVDHMIPVVRYTPTGLPGHVLVAADALAQAFFDGVGRFLVAVYRDAERAKLADERLQRVIVVVNKLDGGKTIGAGA